ncbi:MAG: hypothetical protein PVI86_00275 [Phycisphaerae bacterium]|jgi:hypothetical protein
MQKTMRVIRGLSCFAGIGAITASLFLAGCRGAGPQSSPSPTRVASDRPAKRKPSTDPIRHVLCLYEQKPWLNLDTAGDADFEGIEFRVFLLDAAQKGVLRDGMFHIEMYRIDRASDDQVERTLVSDWHYPTDTFTPVRGILGKGYHVGLRWAYKAIAGTEIELTTRYESPAGKAVRSATKRLRVPKYGP